MPKSAYLDYRVSGYAFGLNAYWDDLPENWVGLFSVLPTDPAATGTEVSYAGYARQQIGAFGWEMWLYGGYGGAYRFMNRDALLFPLAPSDLGVLVGVGIWDAATGGHLLYYGPLTPQLVVYSGTRPYLAVNQLALEAPYPMLTGSQMSAIYGLNCSGLIFPYANSWRVHALVAWPSDWNHLAACLPVDAGYGYAAYGNTTSDWVDVGGAITNAAAITFPAATVDWPDVVGLLFLDDNNVLWWTATLDAAPTVRAGQTLRLPAGCVRFRDL